MDIKNSIYFMKVELLHGSDEMKYIVSDPQEVLEEMSLLSVVTGTTYILSHPRVQAKVPKIHFFLSLIPILVHCGYPMYLQHSLL